MMNDESIFMYFDEGKKCYLKKHELKLSLIYKLGYKIPYDELKRIWQDRFRFEVDRGDYDSLFDKGLTEKGVSYAYFRHLSSIIQQKISQERKATSEFQSLDTEDKGYFTLQDFGGLVAKNQIKFVSPYQLKEIFEEIDNDGDGKASIFDFRNFMQNNFELR